MGKLCRGQILYSGWPQGVGVPDIARKFYLNNWVKNRPDEKMEVDVKGSQENVNAFIVFWIRNTIFLISPKEKEISKLKPRAI